jgi:deazaflavin-dependent oxidoreductase (nitroreductase family)
VKRLRRIGNIFVSALLRSPLHPLLSGSLILLTYRGRRSGREYTLPVMYAEDEHGLIVFVGRASEKTWWRNLRDGSAVRVRLRGADYEGEAGVVADPTAAATYAAIRPRVAPAIGREAEPVFVRIDALRRKVCG